MLIRNNFRHWLKCAFKTINYESQRRLLKGSGGQQADDFVKTETSSEVSHVGQKN